MFAIKKEAAVGSCYALLIYKKYAYPDNFYTVGIGVFLVVAGGTQYIVCVVFRYAS